MKFVLDVHLDKKLADFLAWKEYGTIPILELSTSNINRPISGNGINE